MKAENNVLRFGFSFSPLHEHREQKPVISPSVKFLNLSCQKQRSFLCFYLLLHVQFYRKQPTFCHYGSANLLCIDIVRDKNLTFYTYKMKISNVLTTNYRL